MDAFGTSTGELQFLDPEQLLYTLVRDWQQKGIVVSFKLVEDNDTCNVSSDSSIFEIGKEVFPFVSILAFVLLTFQSPKVTSHDFANLSLISKIKTTFAPMIYYVQCFGTRQDLKLVRDTIQ
jgi:hypothetical protein